MPEDQRLLGQLEEFNRLAERRMERLEDSSQDRFDKFEEKLIKRFSALEKKVNALNEFKWRMAGFFAALSLVSAFFIELLIRYKETMGNQ